MLQYGDHQKDKENKLIEEIKIIKVVAYFSACISCVCAKTAVRCGYINQTI